MKNKIRQAIDNYNKRIAKYLGFYLGIPEEEVLKLINQMKDNK